MATTPADAARGARPGRPLRLPLSQTSLAQQLNDRAVVPGLGLELGQHLRLGLSLHMHKRGRRSRSLPRSSCPTIDFEYGGHRHDTVVARSTNANGGTVREHALVKKNFSWHGRTCWCYGPLSCDADDF